MKVLQRIPKETEEVKAGWKNLSRHWIVKSANIGTLVFTTASLAAIGIMWRQLPPNIPLWYSQPWGDEQLAHPGFLFLLPTTAIVWYGINVLLAVYLTREYRVFAQLLFIASCVVSVLSFFTLIQILFLVT